MEGKVLQSLDLPELALGFFVEATDDPTTLEQAVSVEDGNFVL